MSDPDAVRFCCPACDRRLLVAFEYRRCLIRCPHCSELIRLGWDQIIWAEWRERRRNKRMMKAQQQQIERQRKAMEQKATEQMWQAAEQAVEAKLISAGEAVDRWLQARRYRRAVLAGGIFDLEFLVEDFKDDWVQVQKDTGLTPLKIVQGVKVSSPVAGFAAGHFAGNIWLGLLVAVVTFLAAEPLGEGYARTRFEEWRQKWRRVFANCSEDQLIQFAERLRARSPMVYNSLAEVFGVMGDALAREKQVPYGAGYPCERVFGVGDE